MLRVTTLYASSAGASARYYTKYLTGDGEGIDESGTWLGQEADALRLAGEVSTADLEAILSGLDPRSGGRLGAPLRDRYKKNGECVKAVAGFDATFSAPKEVSIMWAATADDGWLDAHDVAVRAAVAHIERYGATTRVRTKNGRVFPDTGGLTMAAFRQVTSREDDPQIHSHVVISTKVRTDDGGWYALDGRYLKRKQAAIGHLYQSVLRTELTNRYGVAWGPVVNGQAPMLGVPDELIDAFSKRRDQIDAALDDKVADFRQREGRDPTAWERAALTREASADTRAPKTGATSPNLRQRWTDEAAELGWDAERLVDSVRTAARTAHPMDPQLTVNEVIDRCATSSTWSRTEIVMAIADAAAIPAGMDGTRWAAAVERAADRVVESCTTLDPPTTGATARRSDGRSIWIAPIEPYLTTDEVLAQEERILSFAIEAHEQPARPSTTLRGDALDVLQRDAAAAVAGHDDLVLVVGPAGAGKTTMLRAAKLDLYRCQRRVFGVAPTAKAANVLHEETGMPADTLAKLLHEWRRDNGPSARYALGNESTVIVDEAGMVGTPSLDDLIRLAVSQHWRLVLVGDPRQLQAVGRGGMFDELCRTGRTHELAHIHRFQHRWEQAASLELRAGNPESLDPYLQHGRVTAATFDEAVATAARRWIDDTATGSTVALIAETNEHVDALNAAVQAARRERGEVSAPGVRIAGSETASIGDIVVTRRNDRDLRTDRGEPARNRDRWRVDAIRPGGALTLSHLDGHGRVVVPNDYASQHVRLGYAATAHGYQGDTVDIGIMIVTNTTNHRSLYVGATRGRGENQFLVVTDSLDPDEPRRVLEGVLANDHVDLPAIGQRRALASMVPRLQQLSSEAAHARDAVEEARQRLADTRTRLDPLLEPLRHAQQDVEVARTHLRRAERDLADAKWLRRPAARRAVDMAEAHVNVAAAALAAESERAAPHEAEIAGAERDMVAAEQTERIARTRESMERVVERSVERAMREVDHGIDVPGL